MKHFILFLLVYVAPSQLLAQSPGETKKIGVGVILGEPIGPNAKYFFSEEHAVDVGFTYSFEEFFMGYGDYIFHLPNAFRSNVPELQPLTPYFGIGGGIRFSGKSNLDAGDRRSYFFARLPLGLEWFFREIPVGVGLEMTPALSLAPKIFFLLQGGLTARYYF